jgi:hypothetical protein
MTTQRGLFLARCGTGLVTVYETLKYVLRIQNEAERARATSLPKQPPAPEPSTRFSRPPASHMPHGLASANQVVAISAGYEGASSNDGNPWLTGAGAVSKDKKAPSAQLGGAMGFGKDKLYFPSCEPYPTSNKTEY